MGQEEIEFCVLTEVVRASRGRAYCIMIGLGDVSGAEITPIVKDAAGKPIQQIFA